MKLPNSNQKLKLLSSRILLGTVRIKNKMGYIMIRRAINAGFTFKTFATPVSTEEKVSQID
jgi:hypothetical protein